MGRLHDSWHTVRSFVSFRRHFEPLFCFGRSALLLWQVPAVNLGVYMPSVCGDVALPTASVDVPSVDRAGQAPDVPPSVDKVPVKPSTGGNIGVAGLSVGSRVAAQDVEVNVPSIGGEGMLPPAPVYTPSGEADVSMPAVGELSADVGAKVEDLAAKRPEAPSVVVKKNTIGLFGSLSFKKPSLKGKPKVKRSAGELCTVERGWRSFSDRTPCSRCRLS